MTTSPLFQDSRMKLDRARKHIAELMQFAHDHFRAHPPEIESPGPINLLDANGANLKISIRIKSLPKESATILGDAMHNLRAALDLLAVEVVRVTPDSAGNPGNTKNVYFPFSETSAEFEDAVKGRNFHRAGEDAVALVRTYQPYRDGNATLRALHDFDVQDKHKSTIPVGSVASAGVTVKEESGVPMMYPTFPPEPPLIFPEDSVFAGALIFKTMDDLLQMIENMIRELEALVAGRSPTVSA